MTFNEALEILKNATVVEGLHNSENGYMTYFNLLLNQPNSKSFFEELICTSKTSEGILYGLLGMYTVNKNIYYGMIKKIDVNKKVTVIIGDIIGRDVAISYYLPQIEDLSLLRNLQWE
jgi:hypothetical protein